jgi:heme-degrading monooxygenase HmoA
MWEYRVAPEHVDAFVRAYGPDGAWVRLFRRAPGYARTELHRDRADTTRFVTVDYWESEHAWQAFRARFAAEYEALDARCAAFTTHEREIGRFTRVE